MDKTLNSILKVSIIMSVYNAADYLRPAIDGILNQTFEDFEFIIIDDGSKDNSKKIIQSYQDPRIKLVSRPNKGLTASLNEGLALARGEYIARQDADDISVPDRLQLEVDFLDSHPKVGLVGSNYAHMDQKGQETGTVTNVFTHPHDLKMCLVLCNQYGHGSIMVRRSALDKVQGFKGYDPKVGQVEDYDLWVRLSRISDVANIEKPLYKWRKLSESVTHSALDEQVDLTFKVRDKAFDHLLKHLHEYKIFHFHPSGPNYLQRKSVAYRDFAYLAMSKNKQPLAFRFMLAAIACQPLLKLNYKYLAATIYRPWSKRMKFEFL